MRILEKKKDTERSRSGRARRQSPRVARRGPARVPRRVVRKPVSAFATGLLLSVVSACTAEAPRDWVESTPERVGLDRELLEALKAEASKGAFPNIHAILVCRSGRLVMEEYFNGFSADRLQYTASVSKSVGSVLLGMAMEEGDIPGLEDGDVDVPLSAVLPEYAELLQDQGKQDLTLRHVLTMSAGFEWDETSHPYSDPRNDWNRAAGQEDPVRFVLDRPLVAAPGTKFNYNGGLSIILAHLLEEAAQGGILQFAEEHLFAPLGIEEYEWERLPNGMIDTDGGLHLRPRDMAKLGQLYLNGGVWNGEQLVPEAWVHASTSEHVVGEGQPGYGYQWWCGRFQYADRSVFVFMASGHGGQKIYVIPEMDLVVVITHAVFDNPLGEIHNGSILSRYVLPAADASADRGEPIVMDDLALAKFAGRYGSGGDEFAIRYQEGTLTAAAPGSPAMVLTPIGMTRFRGSFLDLLDVAFDFDLDDHDTVRGLRVRYMFNDRRYRRVNEDEEAGGPR